MIKNIKKRDGRKIPFDIQKIAMAIFKSAQEVAKEEGNEADYRIANKLALNVVDLLDEKFKDKTPTVEDVQDAVEKVLIEKGYASTSQKYITYRNERSRVRNSKSRLMKTIGEITFADAKNADVKRENANVDGNTAMGTMLQYGSAVSKEFCKTNMMNPIHSQAHDSGDVHIHDMDFLNMGTLTCCQIDILKLFKNGFSTGHGFLREPNDIMSYSALAAIAIQSNQNDQHGGQSIPYLDFGLAPGVKKTFRKSYRDNLAKALNMFGYTNTVKDAKSIVEDFMSSAEESLGHEISISMPKSLIGEMKVYTERKFEMSLEHINKIFDFAYQEALDETDRKTYQAMEAFIHNLNTMHSRAGAQVPFSSVNFGTDTSEEGRMVVKNLLLATEAGLGNGETPIFPILIFKVKDGISGKEGDPNYDLFKLSCRVSAKRLFPNFCFLDAPFNAQYYQEGRPETEATYMGCRTRVIGNVCGEQTVDGRGNISFSTINLPRLGIKYGIVTGEEADIDGFFAELDEKIDMLIDQLLERMEVQGSKKVKNFPFLMGQGIWRGSENLGPEDTLEEVIKQGTLTVGFIGLAECLKALIGVHHGESDEAQELGLKIISHMRHRMDVASEEYGLNFSLIATPAEGLSGRFTRIDKSVYGEIPGVTDREYYTNSFHVPVYYNISAFDKIDKEAPYHAFTNAGHISYIELDGDPVSNLEAFEMIVQTMKEAGIGYGSINHPVDRDPICGFSGVIKGETCPKCGRKEFHDVNGNENSIGFDRIRRITGYLVGTVDRFNNGKRAEERDRVKHC